MHWIMSLKIPGVMWVSGTVWLGYQLFCWDSLGFAFHCVSAWLMWQMVVEVVGFTFLCQWARMRASLQDENEQLLWLSQKNKDAPSKSLSLSHYPRLDYQPVPEAKEFCTGWLSLGQPTPLTRGLDYLHYMIALEPTLELPCEQIDTRQGNRSIDSYWVGKQDVNYTEGLMLVIDRVPFYRNEFVEIIAL